MASLRIHPHICLRKTTTYKMGSQSVEQRLRTLAQDFRLEKAATPAPPPAPTKRAAVLVCLFLGDDGDLQVILTKRTSTLAMNPGDVALPGGKREEGDADDVETALREAKEEIGLDPSLVNVVTVLDPIVTKRGMAVIPVIGLLLDIKAFSPSPNAAEVEAIFYAPLEMFLKDENRRSEEKEWMGDKYLLHFFNYVAADRKEYLIWALTAGILIRAASVVYQRPPAFPEHRPKFWSDVAAQKIQNTTIPLV